MAEPGGEFYVGYRPQAPPVLGRRLRRLAWILLAGAGLAAWALVLGQGRFEPGLFEYGKSRQVDGLVREHPYPVLLVPAAGAVQSLTLVGAGKAGAGALVAGMDGEPVRILGSLIASRGNRMLEAHEVQRLSGQAAEQVREGTRAPEAFLGRLSVVGEVVDSKCYLGVMRPGRGTTHRACAVRCISGGIPPALRVEGPDGKVVLLYLAGPSGEPVNEAVLPWVGKPVRVTGAVRRSGGRTLLLADPADYRPAGVLPEERGL